MRRFEGKRYWLVGASEGLGRALALRLSRAGAVVIVSARSQDRLDALVEEMEGPGEAVACDVTDQASMDTAATEIGHIDGMIFLAGVYWPFSAKDWDTDKANAMVDINMAGAFRTVGAVLPQMLERDAGHIVLTGSLSGFRGLPGSIGYASSKAGVMHLAEGMYGDLLGTGIDVQLASPGYIKTRLSDKNDFQMPFIMEPEEAAEEFYKHMKFGGFEKSYPRVFSWLFRSSRFWPEWLYYRVFFGKARR